MSSLQFSSLALFGRGYSVTLFRTNKPFLRITNRGNDGEIQFFAAVVLTPALKYEASEPAARGTYRGIDHEPKR